jgi:predicted methyltransferase
MAQRRLQLKNTFATSFRVLTLSLIAALSISMDCIAADTAKKKTEAVQNPPPSGPASTMVFGDELAAIIASPDRSAEDRANDARRKPQQLISFIGVNTGMTVLDLSAGEGYTTELLARAVGPGGRVYAQSAPRQDEPPASFTKLKERAQKKMKAGKIIPLLRKFEDPVPSDVAAKGVELATLMFNYHDLGHLGVDRAKMNKAIFAALKPGSMYVIADHAGRDGTGISESATLHRVEEAFVIKEVKAAGFRFVESGTFLRNPADPRDKKTPEDGQPKDEFVLKFVKP